MRRGWTVGPDRVVKAVWGPHPVQISNGLDALFSLGLSGRNAARRGEAMSGLNGSRYNGDLGPLQSFGRVFGFSPAAVRVTRATAGSATGTTASSNAIQDLLAMTVG